MTVYVFAFLYLAGALAGCLFWALIAHQGHRVTRSQWLSLAVPVLNWLYCLALPVAWLGYRQTEANPYVR